MNFAIYDLLILNDSSYMCVSFATGDSGLYRLSQ
jgi:hypothetical protein